MLFRIDFPSQPLLLNRPSTNEKKVGHTVIKTSTFYSFFLSLISIIFAGCDSNDRSAKGQPYGSGYLIENQMPVIAKEDGKDILNFTDTTNYDVLVEKHENGSLKRKINFSDGKLHDSYTTWFENGQKQTEVSYRLGLRHGASREWYPTGQLKEESNYIDGEVHGKYEGWHENGYKKFEANYSDGQLDGSVYRWTNNGRTISKQSFREGQLIRER